MVDSVKFGIFFFLAFVGVSLVIGQCVIDPSCDTQRNGDLLVNGQNQIDAIKDCLQTQVQPIGEALFDWSDAGEKENNNKYSGYLFTWGPKVKIESWGAKENGLGQYDTSKWTHVYESTAGFQTGRESYTAAEAIYAHVVDFENKKNPSKKKTIKDTEPFDPYYYNGQKGVQEMLDGDSLESSSHDLISIRDEYDNSHDQDNPKYIIAAFDKLYPTATQLVMNRGKVLYPKSTWTPQFYNSYKTGVTVGKSHSGYDSSAGLGMYMAVHPEESREHGGDDARLVRCEVNDVHTRVLNIDTAQQENQCRIQNLVAARILIPFTERSRLLRPNSKNMWADPIMLETAAAEMGILVAFRAGMLSAMHDRPPFLVDKRAIDFAHSCQVVDPLAPFAGVEVASTHKTKTAASVSSHASKASITSRKLRLKLTPSSLNPSQF